MFSRKSQRVQPPDTRRDQNIYDGGIHMTSIRLDYSRCTSLTYVYVRNCPSSHRLSTITVTAMTTTTTTNRLSDHEETRHSHRDVNVGACREIPFNLSRVPVVHRTAQRRCAFVRFRSAITNIYICACAYSFLATVNKWTSVARKTYYARRRSRNFVFPRPERASVIFFIEGTVMPVRPSGLILPVSVILCMISRQYVDYYYHADSSVKRLFRCASVWCTRKLVHYNVKVKWGF